MVTKGIASVGKSFFVKQYEKLSGTETDGSFKKTLDNLVDRFNELQANAAEQGKAVITGQPVDSHDVMIAAQEAGLAFELMLEVRNKLVDAYQELMRIQF